MYLFGAFISGRVKRQRGKIVIVWIITMIVLLSGRGEVFRADVCAAEGRGGAKIA